VVALGVIDDDVVARTAKEHGSSGRVACPGHAELGLEEPRTVAVSLGFELAVHQEQRDEPLTVGVGAHGALDADRLQLRIGHQRLDGAVLECEGHAPAAREPAPNLYLRLIDLTGLAVLPRPRVLVFLLWNTGVAAPARGDVQRLHIGADAEGEAQARGHERLIVRRVDLVERVVFGLDAPTRAVELGAWFVERGLLLVRRVVFFVGRRRRLDVRARPHVSRLPRSELPDEIAVADTHVDDQLLGSIGWAEQIVACRQFEQLAKIGDVLDKRYVAERRDTVPREHGSQVLGTQASNETCRQREPDVRERARLPHRLKLIEVDRGRFEVGADAQDAPHAAEGTGRVDDDDPVTRSECS